MSGVNNYAILNAHDTIKAEHGSFGSTQGKEGGTGCFSFRRLNSSGFEDWVKSQGLVCMKYGFR